MNKKAKSSDTLYLLLIVVVAGFAFWYVSGGGTLIPSTPSEGEITNGHFDEATQQCWPDKDSPIGGEYPIGSIGTDFYQCCLNQEDQQVDCNNPSSLLNLFAIYQGNPGVFSIAHGVRIINTGNVDLTKVWIESATWTPTHAELTDKYSPMIGIASTQSGSVIVGNQRPFSTGFIDLQAIGGTPGNPITYTLSLITKGSATNLVDVSKETSVSIVVEKEAIGFDVIVTVA